MTRDEAIQFYDERRWEPMSFRERAELQLHEKLLCMPFDVFQEAVEKTLGRPVWTHEFGLNLAGLKAELAGSQEAPSMEEIVEMIPADKRIVVEIGK